MTRYLSSFIITSILYSMVIGVFFYAYSNQEFIVKKKVEKKRVSLKHIELVKKIEQKTSVIKKKIIEPIPEFTKPIQKIVKEEKAETKPKKTVKKKVQKKKKIKKIVKKKLEKKIKPNKIVEEKLKKIKELKKEKPKVVREVINREVPLVKKTTAQFSSPSKTSQHVYEEDFLKNNLQLIKKHIQKNVKYSKRARRIGIQGNVLVEFCLSKDGVVSQVKALSGHRLLRKSTIKAIHKAAAYFPKVSRNITIKVPITYKLI